MLFWVESLVKKIGDYVIILMTIIVIDSHFLSLSQASEHAGIHSQPLREV